MAEPDYDLDALIAGGEPSTSGYDLDALIAGDEPQPRRGRGSGSSISAGPAPAGESDTSSSFLGKAKDVGSAVVDMVTGESKQTPETEALPDFRLMPEMRQALISNSLPAVGTPLGAAVAGAEGVLRNASLDPSTGFGMGKAFDNAKANAKTSLGTTMANADEQVRSIVANNPDVKIRKDSKGNTILTSAQNGEDFIVPPGVSPLDAPRVAQTIATTIPAATAGPATVAGRTLGNVASKALAGGIGAAAVEGAQAAGGGDFDAAEIPLAAAANAVGPALSAGKNAVVGAIEKSGASALKAAQEDAAKRAAAAAGKAPSSFKDVVAPIQAVADRVAQLSPKQRWLLKQVPVVGKALDEIDQLAKILKDEAGEGAKKLPQEARDLVDDILKGADDVAADAAPAVADDVAKAAAPEAAAVADDVAAAVEPTITPTPTARPQRGPRAAPTAETVTPPTPSPAPVPEEVTQTARVARAPAPTEGLEPTEILPRSPLVAAAEAAPSAPRRLSRIDDGEVADILKAAALEHGTLDPATLSAKTGLSSSQVTRVLPRIATPRFRAQVVGDAPAAAPKPTSAPLAEASAAPPTDVADAAGASPLRQASGPVPDADLLDALMRQYKGDKQKAMAAYHGIKAKQFKSTEPAGAVGRQRSAVGFDANSPGPAPIATPKGRNRASAPFQAPTTAKSLERAQFEKLAASERMDFIAKKLDEGVHPERLRTRLGISKDQWRSDAPERVRAIARRQAPAGPLTDAARAKDVKALTQSIKTAKKSALQQSRELTPDRAFANGEDAVRSFGGDPYADFAGLSDKAKEQSRMGAAMLDEINGKLGLKGPKRVRTPQEAWAALIRKNPPQRGESAAETIRNKIEALDRASRMMRTIPGWEAFDISADLAVLEAAAKDLSHLENTGIRTLNKDIPF